MPSFFFLPHLLSILIEFAPTLLLRLLDTYSMKMSLLELWVFIFFNQVFVTQLVLIWISSAFPHLPEKVTAYSICSLFQDLLVLPLMRMNLRTINRSVLLSYLKQLHSLEVLLPLQVIWVLLLYLLVQRYLWLPFQLHCNQSFLLRNWIAPLPSTEIIMEILAWF